ncbi:hypothetical protein [Geodermatophilus sp. DF01-2]|nr:hypothetical protein [Geodermatophilus sp. DF01_2]
MQPTSHRCDQRHDLSSTVMRCACHGGGTTGLDLRLRTAVRLELVPVPA